MTPEQLLAQLEAVNPLAASHFARQLEERKDRWAFEDWIDRAQATLAFYAANEWDGVRWGAKKDQPLKRRVSR